MKKLVLVVLLCFTPHYGNTIQQISKSKSSYNQSLLVKAGFATIKNYPFMGRLRVFYTTGDRYCGTTILSFNVTLTSAKCLLNTINLIRIIIGTAFPDNRGVHYLTTTYLRHAIFKPWRQDYDIGLVKSDVNFNIDKVVSRFVVLRPQGRALEEGTYVTILGWGKMKKGHQAEYSKSLRKTIVPVIPYQLCQTIMRILANKARVTPRMFCGGEEEDYASNFCTGDEGGPALNSDNEQVGIMATTIDCGVKGIPSIFTDIGVLRSWIRRNAKV